METGSILEILLKQSPLIGLLGFMLYKIWSAYTLEKEKKDAMAEALIKITTLWEEKYNKESQNEVEIKQFMTEIREFIKELKNGK